MKTFMVTLLLIAGFSSLSQAQDSTEAQKMMESFYQEHEVAQSYFYCRTDIKAPECRTLILYKNKQTGKMTSSFQMAFSAPFRQAAGTELFIMNESAKDTFHRIVDTTVDGKMNGTLENSNQVVLIDRHTIQIKDIKLGTMIADLSFSHKSSELKGVNNGQPVQVSYPRMSAQQ